MAVRCGTCGTENPDGFKFCGGCGTSLASRPGSAPATSPAAAPPSAAADRRAEERKVVTILFADVRGFTALSERMDPEEVRDMIQALFARLSEAVLRFGGSVDKYIGDCVMAVFGTPTAHENDPERAVRAALAMQREVEAFAAERGLDIGVRIGVNTGAVLAGYVGDRAEDFTVMGDEVNLAARLEQAAPVGGILVSQKTHRAVEPLFEFEPLEPLRVKGKAAPVPVFRALRERRAADADRRARVRVIDSRMVGRAAELERMLACARASRESGEGRLLLVASPAGVGKSRLLYEFHRALMDLDDPPRTFKGRALPYAADIPHYLFGMLLKDACRILDEDGAAEARSKLVHGVAETMGGPPEAAEEAAHLMGSLIHLDFPGSPYVEPLRRDPVQLLHRGRRAFTEFFLRAAERPTVLYLEDLHWAERSSLELAAEVLRAGRRRPLLIVCAARPEYFERFPDARGVLPPDEEILLDALEPAAVRDLVGDLLRRAGDVPERLLAEVVEKAGGNPFYVEEIVKMYVETGVVVRGEGDAPWRIVEERLGEVEIPDTIQGLLQARLDHLSVNEKGVLQRAAVVGRTFWQGAIDALLEGMTIARSEPVLQDLRRKEFIFDSQTALFMHDEYIFKHALLRDVTYETILKKHRARWHGAVAEWIERCGGDRLGEFLPLVALHHDLGGNRERAREFYYLAGERARATFAVREALSYYDRAAVLSDAPSFSVLRRRGSMYEILGRYAEALRDYEAALAAARGPVDEGVALKHLTEIRIRRGEYDAARAHADRAMEIGEHLGDGRMIAETLNLIGRIHDYTGETEAALGFYTRSMERHRVERDALGEATALGNVGIIRMYRGEYERAIGAYRAALEIDRRQENKRRMTMMTSNLGETFQLLGVFDEAEARHREALALAREIGFRMMEVELLRNLGTDLVLAGRTEEGLPLLRDALAMADELGDMEMLPQVLVSLADGLVRAGRSYEAAPHVARLLAVAEERGLKEAIARGLLLQSRISPAGEAGLERALALAEALHARRLVAEIRTALAAAAADPEAVRRHAEAAREAVREMARQIEDPSLRARFLRHLEGRISGGDPPRPVR